jgi:glycosyltransferase involved in cell wall biosynthesis
MRARLRDGGVECEIVLVGDGPMRANVERAIRDYKLEGQVEITGWISGDRVRREKIAARALVLPSFSENMPVVIMEAMALGRNAAKEAVKLKRLFEQCATLAC